MRNAFVKRSILTCTIIYLLKM